MKDELKLNPRSDPYVHEVVYDIIKNKISRDDKILDIGCGTGAFLYKIRNLTNNRYGCDFNVKQYGEKENFKNIKKIDLNKGELYYDNEKFDIVLSIDVLEHLYHPYLIIQEGLRILKKNGFFIISTTNMSCFIQRIYFLLTGKMKGFWVKEHSVELGERHFTPIFRDALLESINGKAKIIQDDFNRTIIPKFRIEIKTKNAFLSENSIWVIKKN